MNNDSTLRVLLVDDEDLARARMRSLVSECPDPPARVVGEAASSALALGWLERNACDVVMLDIQMPGTDGRQLAALLRQRMQQGHAVPAVVFVTAHAQHALEAFELNATDYLTKPVRRERLQAALQKVAHQLGRPRMTAPAPLGADEPVIIVNDRGRMLRIPVSQVLYLRAEQKYVTLRTPEHTYVLDEALSDLEQRLGKRFLRIHRNALVARHAVRALEKRAVDGDDEGGEGWAVQVAPLGEWLAVSRRQLTAVRETLASGGL